MPGQDKLCKFYVSQFGLAYCTSTTAYLSGVLFSQACKLSCNLCNVVTSTLSTTKIMSTTTVPITTSKTSSPSGCQNLPSQDSLCKFYVTQFGLTYCTSTTTYISGVLFSQACKFSCNLCNVQTSTTTTTTLRSNPCVSSPCQNGGSCSSQNPLAFTCTCSPGYTGNFCEALLDYCSSPSNGGLNPCLNNGVCISNFGGYTCVCQSMFTGENCQLLVIKISYSKSGPVILSFFKH